MIMADILFWFLILLGAYVVFVAHWVGAYGLFPAVVERARATYGARPIAATFLGLGILVPAVAIATLAMKLVPHPLMQIPMTGFLLVLELLCLIGSAGLALRIGAGLASPLDATQPWRRILRGGLVLGLVFLMPFLGWFVVLPWTLASGMGAFVLSRRATRFAEGAMRASAARAPSDEELARQALAAAPAEAWHRP
jgi:hypothetical protein